MICGQATEAAEAAVTAAGVEKVEANVIEIRDQEV